MPQFTNRQLWEAWLSLERLGEVDLPPFSIGFRLGLNRNHLRPEREAIDKERRKLIAKHEVGAEHPEAGKPARLAAFSVEWDELLAVEVEWAPHGTIPQKAFQDQHDGKAVAVKANDIAALVVVGIIIPEEVAKS